jgi:hypothetical protein
VWPSADALRTAIGRALDATRARYGAYVADTPRVYAGFSQGAALGAAIVGAPLAGRDGQAPEAFGYAIFLEGLGDVGSRGFARAFQDRGGKRVLVACSQLGCEASRRARLAALGRAEIDAKLLYLGPIGHTVNGAVISGLRAEIPWLVAGDEAWQGVPE